GRIVSSQMATSAMAPATATCARQRGRTNASAASAPSPNAAAKGRRKAENGKSNQSAPRAQATPITKTSVTTPKRNKRTKKRHTWMTRDFDGGEESGSLFCDMGRQANSKISLHEGRAPFWQPERWQAGANTCLS